VISSTRSSFRTLLQIVKKLWTIILAPIIHRGPDIKVMSGA
jgi:hypothetical protein